MHSEHRTRRSSLLEGWVIANHILVSFHVAFISSVLALPAAAIFKADVLRFIFLSWETLVSALFMAITFHVGIALHELGHFVAAARLNALNEKVAIDVKPKLDRPFFGRMLFLAGMILRIPFRSNLRRKAVPRHRARFVPRFSARRSREIRGVPSTRA